MQEHLSLWEEWVIGGKVGRWFICNDYAECVATKRSLLIMGWAQ
jgi:hypothetical protein